MCVLISLVFTLIGIVSYFGDYEREEIKKDYEKYQEICSRNTTKTTKPK